MPAAYPESDCRRRFRDRLGLLSLAIFFLWLPCPISIWAQYGYQVWTADNGLPRNGVRGVTQTPDGYLWISTLDGLVRFDGIGFTVFNKGNSPGIISNRFTVIERGRDGDLWVVYESGGLLRYHDGHFRTYDTKDGIPGSVVSTVTSDSSGHVWILSRGQIAQWNEKADRFELSSDLNKRIYGPLVWDETGFVAYDKAKIYCFSRGHYEVYQLPLRIRGKVISQVGLDQDRTAWVNMSDGELIRLGAGDPFQPHELAPQKQVSCRGPDGKTWIFSPTLEMNRSIVTAPGREHLNLTFRYAFPDNQGNLWLATEEGLYRIQDQVIRVLSTDHGLQDQDVYPVYQDRSGAVWMGVWHKGLSRFQNGKFQTFGVAEGLPSPLVTSLYQDGGGRIWIATHGGLTTYQNGHFSNAGVPSFPDDVVQAIYQDRTGTMWFGRRSGVSSLKNNILKPFPARDETAPRDVHVIAETPNGDLWVGGVNGLFQLHEGRAIHWSESEGLGSNNIWSLHADCDGTLWIGTFDGGLARLKNGHVTRYTTANGLFNDGVFQILDDDLGNLWMSCDLGIYRVNKRELIDMAEGKLTSISSIAFGKADGLRTLDSNGGVSPAGTRASDGTLWFPTQDGVAIVDPRKVSIDLRTPRISIESATLDWLSVPVNAPIPIPPSKYNLQIHYTAPDFARPNQLRFRYKLVGLDQDWTEAGFHRFASYTHLPPGHYQFIVSVKNADGSWSAPSKILPVDVFASFYKTKWFELLVLSTIAVIAIAVWRYRLSELKAKSALQLDFLQQLITSQEDERQRIARELHDSLGQRLVIINSSAKLALRFRGNSVKSDESIFEEISSEAIAGLEDTRSIAYDLRPSHLDRLGLTQSIYYLVQKASAASNMSIIAKLENIDDLLPPDQWINLYRIVQEAVGNAIKYSSASTATVCIEKNNKQTVMTIEDDGVGFEVDGNINKAGRMGMGLRGMAERAALIGSEFAIRSAPGKGTVITLQINTIPKV